MSTIDYRKWDAVGDTSSDEDESGNSMTGLVAGAGPSSSPPPPPSRRRRPPDQDPRLATALQRKRAADAMLHTVINPPSPAPSASSAVGRSMTANVSRCFAEAIALYQGALQRGWGYQTPPD